MSSAESRKPLMTGAFSCSVAGLVLMAIPTFPFPWRGHDGENPVDGMEQLSWFAPTLLGNGQFLALPAALAAIASVVLGFLKWRSEGRRFIWAPAIWALVSAVLAIIGLIMTGAVTLGSGLAVAAMIFAAGVWTQAVKPAVPDALPTDRR